MSKHWTPSLKTFDSEESKVLWTQKWWQLDWWVWYRRLEKQKGQKKKKKNRTLMLKGPGLILSPLISQCGSIEAMNRPRYKDTIWPARPDMVMGDVRKWKNWLTNDKKMHNKVPIVHVRNVSAGSDGSSVSDTVNFTCSICEEESSSSSSSCSK